MSTANITSIQQKIGATPDGFWGPKSMAAVQYYLRSLMPLKNPWPKSDQESLSAFYGAAGDEDQLVSIVVPQGVKYEGKPCTTLRCHYKVKDSLLRILPILVTLYPDIAGEFNGCFANRPMRGGSLPSLHARGAAVDFDCDNNGNHTHWPLEATMPLGVMEIFAREGWVAAGAFWSRDAMHFQATL